MKKRITILVSEYYRINQHVDDLTLKKALLKENYYVDIINWDNKEYDFEKSDLVIIRSCWDYDQRVDEFLETMQGISSKTKLINPLSTIIENSSKLYLHDLSIKGIPIVQTEFLFSPNDIASALDNISTEMVILKPTVSASGRNTFRFSKDDPDLIMYSSRILEESSAMLQPYIDSIETSGEKSTVVINNEIVFTMNKIPAEGNFLVHTHHGGQYIPDKVDASDMAFIQKIISNLPDETAYVRIDYLHKENNPLLLELEMIEPNLYLHKNPIGLSHLVNYIKQAL
ncbi:hypothetical protein EZV73_25840 [Acidaminobacter sp. JC074]|uniref:ATP-grasp domain-containing protein n=1 Tax=Acidaminobacter sp. JC074 TaxID=2530199 RepID=UPI001F0FCBDC|nr:hypothetical protein [Acidaminobacter sp. JC074]MCH4891026.1 hypothetical protein [Acidaminobacter sp. JC074]